MNTCKELPDYMFCTLCCSDLDLAAMKALGQVLNGLVLQPRGMTGDIIEQKSKLFQRYTYTCTCTCV